MDFNSKGFSLIEIVVALGIFAFVSMAFASFMSHTAREFRASNQKSEMLSFERDLEIALRVDTDSCTNVIQNNTFNRAGITGTSGPIIQLPNGISNLDGTVLAAPNQLLMGTNTGLRVDRTELEVIRELPIPNNHVYQGRLRVFMDPASTVRSFAPTQSEIWFEVDSASGPGSRLIQGCVPAVVATPCDVGQVQVGAGNGQAVCTNVSELQARVSYFAQISNHGAGNGGTPLDATDRVILDYVFNVSGLPDGARENFLITAVTGVYEGGGSESALHQTIWVEGTPIGLASATIGESKQMTTFGLISLPNGSHRIQVQMRAGNPGPTSKAADLASHITISPAQ